MKKNSVKLDVVTVTAPEVVETSKRSFPVLTDEEFLSIRNIARNQGLQLNISNHNGERVSIDVFHKIHEGIAVPKSKRINIVKFPEGNIKLIIGNKKDGEEATKFSLEQFEKKGIDFCLNQFSQWNFGDNTIGKVAKGIDKLFSNLESQSRTREMKLKDQHDLVVATKNNQGMQDDFVNDQALIVDATH